MTERLPVPQGTAPMLAVHAPAPAAPGWSFEVKWDGHRVLLRVVDSAVGLRSRGGHDTTASVPGIQGLGDPHGAGPPVTYLVFDVLHLDGRSCLGLAGLEGVVAKEASSPYRPGGRSPAWRKLVNLRTVEVVVGGWQPGAGRRAGTVGSLLVGVAGPDGLRYAGHVGTGFADAALDSLSALLGARARSTSPFAGPVPRARARTARWVDPVVAGEVAFSTWTSDGLLRQARWRGVRGG